MDAKTLIISSFALMIILGVIGVILYYQQLEPFRLISSIKSPATVLDRVELVEYTARDLEGATYIVKLYNDPVKRSGYGEVYNSNGDLLFRIRYTYDDNGIVYAWKESPNGTLLFNYTGGYIVQFEDAFYTGINYTINATGAIVAYEPFPGIPPLYLPVYLADYLQIDWNLLASLTKPRNANISKLVDVRIIQGETTYLDRKVDAIIISTEPFVTSPPNKWAASRISMAIVVDENINLPVVASWSIESARAGQLYSLSFNLTNIEFHG